MKHDISLFLQNSVEDLNLKEKRSGQIIISPHWYSLVLALSVIGSFVLFYFLKNFSPYLLVGLFPFYILAIIFIFEAKQQYTFYSDDFLKHKINTHHLSKFYQSLDKDSKAAFREIILTKKQNITYNDIKHLT